MDLIELAEQLTIGEIAEIFAHKLLKQEQGICKAVQEEATISDADKRAYRDVLASTKELATHTQDVGYEQLFDNDLLRDAINLAIDDHAEEYVRIL